MLREIEHKLLHMGIHHTTIQFEDESHPHERQLLCSLHNGGHTHILAETRFQMI